MEVGCWEGARTRTFQPNGGSANKTMTSSNDFCRCGVGMSAGRKRGVGSDFSFHFGVLCLPGLSACGFRTDNDPGFHLVYSIFFLWSCCSLAGKLLVDPTSRKKIYLFKGGHKIFSRKTKIIIFVMNYESKSN